MGDDVDGAEFTHRDPQRYRTKIRQCLTVLAQMLAGSTFDDDGDRAGMEIELNLVDGDGQPAMRNAEILQAIANPDFQTELGQFNLEINVAPRGIAGAGLDELETDLRASLNDADGRARSSGARMVMIGILPTLGQEHLDAKSFSADRRYSVLNDQIIAARGEEISLHIDGPETLSTTMATIAPEAACTSVQLHLQVAPASYAPTWNAAQCIAAIQVALGANSPYLFGRELWRETRIPLFEQATDTRPEELQAQGVRPRVWFGERWITSVFDQFEENARYFPALLPICDEEDPTEVWASGATPRLAELRMHNGTIYRWNRPVYDIADDVPHLRVENRVLPAGPTVVDVLANAAFYYGVVRSLVDEEQPIWSRLSFESAKENFFECARRGIHAQVVWPGTGRIAARDVALRYLLPLAYSGLDSWGVNPTVRDKLLGIIEGRCEYSTNGAEWQVDATEVLDAAGGSDRSDQLRAMLEIYVEHMHDNEPVHTWPLPQGRSLSSGR